MKQASPRVPKRASDERDALLARPGQPVSHGHGQMISLQRTAGNRATGSIVVQARLTVGRADDPLERAADRVADHVMDAMRSGVSLFQETTPATTTSVHRHSAAADPLGGLAVPSSIEAEIEQSRSGGIGLPQGLRRTAEAVTGADLSGVRIHGDDRSDRLARSLQADAFATGSDIFLRRGTPAPGTPAGDRLLAHEVAHVVQQGAARSIDRSQWIRRDVTPTAASDPVAHIAPGSHDLLYGLNFPRAKTKGRLAANQKVEIRTIDDYNRACGINAVIRAASAAMGLYQVRAALDSAAAWPLTPDVAIYQGANIAVVDQWTAFLRGRAAYVGLKDLGAKGGWFEKDKINKKGRFKKNRKESQANDAKGDRLTPSETRAFLDPANTQGDAQALYNAMSAKKQTALNEWVYRAFFRRTSKLGQDFIITVLGAHVHFNTAGDLDYDPATRTPGPNGATAGALGQVNANQEQNRKNRPITVSEYRHMLKLRGNHPGAFNLYDEG